MTDIFGSSKIRLSTILSTVIFPGVFNLLYAQVQISGSVKEKETGEPLVGVNIVVKGKLIGTITDVRGNFELSTQTEPPFTLVFSHIGYEKKEVEVSQNQSQIQIELAEESILGQEIVVSASRFEENILESPVTIEKLDLIDIRENPSGDFYDGLGNLKGVDINRQSFTFKVPNSRGFNGNNNFRINQLVDGVDNAPPGLSFAAGNIFGLNQLDVENVEYLIGASSALYGPGGMNGTILMNSKSPFKYQGLSVMAQTGVMHVNKDYRDNPYPMYDLNLRYAKSYKDKFAFKVAAGYVRALDWHAVDYRDRTDLDDPTLTRQTNPGYDGVNVYGDEVIIPVNLSDRVIAEGAALQQGLTPGTQEFEDFVTNFQSLMPDQIVTRTGYNEEDVVDYDTENVRINSSIHYRLTENLEAILSGGFGSGTAVYTAQNRFSLVDFRIFKSKLEFRGPDFFARAWWVKERSGDAYDAGAVAALINEAWKPSQQWYAEYIETFITNFLGLNNPEVNSHRIARIAADQGRAIPGTAEFNNLFNRFAFTPVDQGGAKVIDKTMMFNLEGMYNFSNKIKFADILIGASHRIYSINSEGTIFFDEPGDPIIQNQFGAYFQMTRKFIDYRLKITTSARYDKNEYFEGRITPRGSFVYSFGEDRKSNFRGSVQTAFRFAPTADQWTDLNVGPFRVLGGNPEVHLKYNFDTNPVFPLLGTNTLDSRPDTTNGPFIIPQFRPERVTSFELGYKGLFMSGKLMVDSYGYLNTFNGFLAKQNLVQNPGTPEEKRYQTTISTDEPVTSYGWAIGGEYRAGKGYIIRGNIAFNTLETTKDDELGFETRFNAPDYRTNLGLSNPDFYNNFGFSINWKWQNEFLWQSAFGVGEIPEYHNVDAQVSYKWENMKSLIKVGASNLLNDGYTTGFGNPQIGGIYYVSVTFDEFMN